MNTLTRTLTTQNHSCARTQTYTRMSFKEHLKMVKLIKEYTRDEGFKLTWRTDASGAIAMLNEGKFNPWCSKSLPPKPLGEYLKGISSAISPMTGSMEKALRSVYAYFCLVLVGILAPIALRIARASSARSQLQYIGPHTHIICNR